MVRISEGAATGEKSKEVLEREKLQAEIDELRVKLRWGPWMTVPAVGIALITLWSGVSSLQQSIDDKSKEFQVRLDQQVVELVSRLESDTTGSQTVVLLLATYGRDAVPPLLWNLQRARRPDAIIQTLRLIKEKPGSDPADVLRPLFRTTRETILRELNRSSDAKDVRAIGNCLTAVGQLGTDDKAAALRLIKDLQASLTRATKLSQDDRVSIEESLASASRALEEAPARAGSVS
jgi:hypothetical protein